MTRASRLKIYISYAEELSVKVNIEPISPSGQGFGIQLIFLKVT